MSYSPFPPSVLSTFPDQPKHQDYHKTITSPFPSNKQRAKTRDFPSRRFHRSFRFDIRSHVSCFVVEVESLRYWCWWERKIGWLRGECKAVVDEYSYARLRTAKRPLCIVSLEHYPYLIGPVSKLSSARKHALLRSQVSAINASNKDPARLYYPVNPSYHSYFIPSDLFFPMPKITQCPFPKSHMQTQKRERRQAVSSIGRRMRRGIVHEVVR
jgi:hypothetical protein